jgi:hypothetical protein
MKKLLLTTTAFFGLLAGVASATPFTDQVITGLQAQGFDHIEIVQGVTQLKVEAIRGTSTVEIVYDLATGTVLKQETGTVEPGNDTTPGVEIASDDTDFVDEADDATDDTPDTSGSDESTDDSTDDSSDDSTDDSSDDTTDSSDDDSDDSSAHDAGDDHGDHADHPEADDNHDDQDGDQGGDQGGED